MSVEVEIEWKGKKVKVYLDRISWGKHQEIKKQTTNVKLIGEKVITTPDPFLYQELLVLEGLRAGGKCPFELTLNNIKELSDEDGNKLYNLMTEIQAVNKEKKTASDNTFAGSG